MSVQRITRGGKVRWKVQIWQGREYVGGRTFDSERAARRWEATEKAKMLDGFQPKLGRIAVADFADEWLEWREGRVQPRTLTADRQMLRLLPTWMTKLELAAVSPRQIERWQDRLTADGLSRNSVIRHRQALSGLFARAVEEGRLRENPVSRASTPSGHAEPDELHPFTAEEVYALADSIAARDWWLAEVVLILFWTGLRWGEARALTVGDYVRDPVPILRVSKSHPEGTAKRKTTKSGKSRSVPLYEQAIPLLDRAAYGKRRDELLLTTSHLRQLHRHAFVRSTDWAALADGRRIHDLRHSAICWWLSAGLPLHVVKAMAGHASIKTTERYLHFVGDAAARTVLDRLNHAGQTPSEPNSPYKTRTTE